MSFFHISKTTTFFGLELGFDREIWEITLPQRSYLPPFVYLVGFPSFHQKTEWGWGFQVS